jgi:two-component system, NtrC family, sensor kinase
MNAPKNSVEIAGLSPNGLERAFERMSETVPSLAYQLVQRSQDAIELRWIDPRCADVLGVDPTALQTSLQSFCDRLHADDAEQFWRSLRQSAQTGQLWSWRGRWCSVTSPLVSSDSPDHWLQTLAQPYATADCIIWDGVLVSVRPVAAAPAMTRPHRCCLPLDLASPLQMRQWMEQTEQYVQNVIANVPGAVYRRSCEPPWRMEYITDAVEDICGYAAGCFSGDRCMNWDDVIYPDDRPMVNSRVADAIVRHAAFEVEYRITHADGGVRWVSERGRATFDAAGIPLNIDGVIVDISDRKRNEFELSQLTSRLEALVEERTRELQHSKARLEMLLSCAPVILYALDLDGNFILSEGKGLEALGLKPGEVVGQSVRDLYPDNPQMHDFLDQVYSGEYPASEQSVYINQLGDTAYENHYAPLLNETGEAIGVIGIALDITERQQAEKALQRSQEQLNAIINNASAAIYVKDLQGRYTLLNREMGKMLGRSPDTLHELLGATDYDLFPADLAETFRRNDQQTLDNKRASQFEEMAVIEQHEHTYLSVKFPLLDADGQPYAICGISTDISDRKRFEQDFRERDRLLNGVALATSLLLTIADHHDAIQQALAVLGITAAVDRIYVFENSYDSAGEPLMSQRYEWTAAGISPEIDNPQLQNLPYRAMSIDWYTTLVSGLPVMGCFDSFAEPIQATLKVQNIRSLILMPIEIEGTVWGFVGCDDCQRDRQWSNSEQSILRAAAGSLGGAIARQRTETQLQESRQLLQLVMDNIPHVVFWKDRQSRYMGGNRNFLKTLGVESIEPILGKTDYELPYTDAEREDYVSTDRQVMETGQPQSHVIESRLDRNGIERWYENNKVPLQDESGNIVGVLGTFEEITERVQSEMVLRDFRQRQTLLLEQTPVAIIEWDIDLNVREWNPAAERIFGYRREEVLGQPLGFLIPDHRRDTVRSIMTELMLTPHTICEIGENITKTGDRVICEWYDIPLVAATGDVVGIASMAVDVTQREQAQAELRKSQQRLSLLIQQTPLAVIDWTPDGHIEDWNPSAERIFGYSHEEAVGRSFHFLVPEWIGGAVGKIFQELSESGNSGRSTNENITKDGRVIVCEWYNTPLIAPSGEVLGIVSAVMDVTEQRQSEQALRRSNAMLTAQREASIDGILVLDEHRRIVSYNQRFCDIWTIDAGQVEQEGDRLIVQLLLAQLSDSNAFLDSVDYLYEHPEQDSRDELTLQDGRVLDSYSAPVRSHSGEFYGRVWYFRDITGRKRTEAQLRQQTTDLEQALRNLQRTQAQLVQSEKMSSLGQLVAGVAHEINNPVNFIYGNLVHATDYIQNIVSLLGQYRQRYPNPGADIEAQIEDMDLEFLIEDLPRLLGSMRVGSERIREIVYSLRTFSRLDEADLKPVNIHDGIESTLLILHNRIKSKQGGNGIEVVKHYGNLPPVECYAGQLNQVFMNILSNAIDAIENYRTANPDAYADEQPAIAIHTEQAAPGWVRIRIVDNGPGMSDAVRQQLFNPFFTTKPVGKGTGLGMSISHQIVVDRHSGTLTCHSTPGTGTEFIITIPQSVNFNDTFLER